LIRKRADFVGHS